jgi:hypothetical protein
MMRRNAGAAAAAVAHSAPGDLLSPAAASYSTSTSSRRNAVIGKFPADDKIIVFGHSNKRYFHPYEL